MLKNPRTCDSALASPLECIDIATPREFSCCTMICAISSLCHRNRRSLVLLST
jgi:hypothetical protein